LASSTVAVQEFAAKAEAESAKQKRNRAENRTRDRIVMNFRDSIASFDGEKGKGERRSCEKVLTKIKLDIFRYGT
jgi:hypothetical protein